MTDYPGIHYTQINQLEGLRRMQHDRDIRRPKPPISNGVFMSSSGPLDIQINYVSNPRRTGLTALEDDARRHPCKYVGHRPAWLNNGGMACGVCGAYL